MNKLLKTIKKLRHPLHGSKWYKKQTHKSLMPYIIEEAYEVLEAIDENSPKKLKEELGDLLLQIIIHSIIAEENKKFKLNDVINTINKKMIDRNSHVFKNISEKALDLPWEEIKNKEISKKNNNPFPTINKSQSSLLQALEISKEAKKLNFDWKTYKGPLNKTKEELDEVNKEINKKIINKEKLENEIGDLFFSIVNLCRHMKIDPEIAMFKANKKFIKRFNHMLDLYNSTNEFKDSSLKKKEENWEKAKKL
tara:strand:+ start:3324 stop:4079 length:756 start_codon:yes stop_codon:yes gene_type:complete